MLSYKSEEEEALDILDLLPEDVHNVQHVKIKNDDYIEILFKFPTDEIYSYVNTFRNLECHPLFDGRFYREIKDCVEDRFFFRLPDIRKVRTFDHWYLPLALDGWSKYV